MVVASLQSPVPGRRSSVSVGSQILTSSHSPLRQLLEYPDQLFFGSEIDFDSPARAVADDAHARAEQHFQAIFCGARVHVHRLRRRRLAWRAFLGDALDDRFGLAHGET